MDLITSEKICGRARTRVIYLINAGRPLGRAGCCGAKDCNRWQASITVNNKQVHLGLYKTFEAALEIRKLAEKERIENES
jgi:hypothetical protein